MKLVLTHIEPIQAIGPLTLRPARKSAMEGASSTLSGLEVLHEQIFVEKVTGKARERLTK